VYVTPDQIEAMTLGQRVVVLREGAVQQIDTPQRLYHHPVNLFVAAFIGSPAMNFVYGKVTSGTLDLAGVPVPVPGVADREVIVGVRPTGLMAAPHASWPTIDVVPDVIEELGDERYVIFDVDAPRVDTDATRAAVDARTSDDALLQPADRARFTARLTTDVPVAIGSPLQLAVDPARLSLFDPETGEALPTGC
jgi:multiple sugar transport system ATP-binding protein